MHPPNAQSDKQPPSQATDPRLATLTHWVGEQLLAQRLIADASSLQFSVASADASFRRYFRYQSTSGQSWIGMDAPPEQEDSASFLRVAELINQAGVNAPSILATDLAQGFLLISDLGQCDYQDQLTKRNADALYGDAIKALVTMQQQLQSQAENLPRFDDALYAREYELFTDWLLQRHLGITLSTTERKQLDACYAMLVASAKAQPQVFVHRDYHSRNLMQCTAAQGGNPGVIDFQDAVLGPLSYDLVSLLRDCYIAWPEADVQRWLERYLSELQAAGGVAYALDEFTQWFDWMGLQRHIKAIGIFARLHHRDGKSAYLADMPRTGNYIRQIAARYSEMSFLAELLEQRILPALSASELSAAGHQS